MPAKLWCDHTESFRIKLESLGAGRRRMGTRFWNCVGRCSQVYSDMMNKAPIFIKGKLHLGTYANSAVL